MKSYLLKLSGWEEGPYSESQIAQMFADQQVNRSTPCKPETSGDWKTIDDYLPMLKYGTQLPAPTKPPPLAPAILQSSAPSTSMPSFVQRISLVDIDLPFGSILKLMFKWAAAGFIVTVCFIPAAIIVWLIMMAIMAVLMGGALSSFHHP